MEDFILTDKIDEGVCKNLINVFECNSKFHFEGQVAGTGGEYDHVDISQKKSTDLELSNFTFPVKISLSIDVFPLRNAINSVSEIFGIFFLT